MGLLTGKIAVITGGGRGIGKAIALKYASEGAKVAITEIEINDVVEQAVGEIQKTGNDAGTEGLVCKAYCGNVADNACARQNVEDILADFGTIDILVNNAGITKDGLLLRMSESQWDAVLDVNLKGAFNFTQAVLPTLAGKRAGSIINLSSVVGEHGNAGQANYAASKAGLIALAKSVAKEMGPRGIRANCIAPGFIITDMTLAMGEERLREWEKTIPMRRGGSVEEVAKVALFLASDLSSYVSGQVISCCGAMNC